MYRQKRMQEHYAFRNRYINIEGYVDSTTNFKCKFFDFSMNHEILSGFGHFQLKNNVQCPNSDEVYVRVASNEIIKYNPITKEREIVASNIPFTVVSFFVFENNILLGGMGGEIILQDLEQNRKFSWTITDADSRIATSVKMFIDEESLNMLISDNDMTIRIIDGETQTEKKKYEFAYCVNHATVSNDMKKIGLCLDSTEDLIIDKKTGEIIHTLRGHADFGFSID